MPSRGRACRSAQRPRPDAPRRPPGCVRRPFGDRLLDDGDDVAGADRSDRRSTLISLTVPAIVGGDVVLHLHGLEHARRPGRPRPSSPTSTSTFTIVPCIGTVTVAAAGRRRPAAAAGPLRAGLAGGRRPRRRHRRPRRRRDSGTHSATAKPLAVDLDVDVARGPSARLVRPRPASAAGLATSTPDRSSASSTHLVECSAVDEVAGARGWRGRRGAWWRCPRCGTRASARSMRPMAVSRSEPHTMSLPTRLS